MSVAPFARPTPSQPDAPGSSAAGTSPAWTGSPSSGARTWAVTSGKGGVGKTLVSANVCAALAALGARVLALDADLGLANLDVVLDVAPRRTLHDVLTGRCALDEALLPVPAGFTLLPAGSGLLDYARLTADVRDGLRRVMESLARRYDHIVIDTGAGISDIVLHAISLADEVIVVTTPEPTALTDAYATVKVLATQQRRTRLHVVVNQTAHAGQGAAVAGQLQHVVDRFVSPQLGLPVRLHHLGDVPEDGAVREAVRQRQLLVSAYPGTPAALGLAALAASLHEARSAAA